MFFFDLLFYVMMHLPYFGSMISGKDQGHLKELEEKSALPRTESMQDLLLKRNTSAQRSNRRKKVGANCLFLKIVVQSKDNGLKESFLLVD